MVKNMEFLRSVLEVGGCKVRTLGLTKKISAAARHCLRATIPQTATGSLGLYCLVNVSTRRSRLYAYIGALKIMCLSGLTLQQTRLLHHMASLPRTQIFKEVSLKLQARLAEGKHTSHRLCGVAVPCSMKPYSLGKASLGPSGCRNYISYDALN